MTPAAPTEMLELDEELSEEEVAAAAAVAAATAADRVGEFGVIDCVRLSSRVEAEKAPPPLTGASNFTGRILIDMSELSNMH